MVVAFFGSLHYSEGIRTFIGIEGKERGFVVVAHDETHHILAVFYRLAHPYAAGGVTMKAGYRVHRFDIRMKKDQSKLEQFLNGLDGEVVAIIPNIAVGLLSWAHHVDFLLIVEKVR